MVARSSFDLMAARRSSAAPRAAANRRSRRRLLERIVEGGYQVCVFDPEGDYAEFRSAVVFGDAKAAPQPAEFVKLLERPDDSFVINMLAVPFEDRPALLSDFISAIANLRAKIGRPHWVLMDEAHHLLPAERDVSATASLEFASPGHSRDRRSRDAGGRRAAAKSMTFSLSATRPRKPSTALHGRCRFPRPSCRRRRPAKGEALFWRRSAGNRAQIMKSHAPAEKAERHIRKYAEGALGEDKSFYFRGPSNALNLRAQNLTIFMQMADGVDDETWLHHLQAHDYSRWVREAIKDDELADELAADRGSADARSESDPTLGARGDRAQVHRARVRALAVNAPLFARRPENQ